MLNAFRLPIGIYKYANITNNYIFCRRMYLKRFVVFLRFQTQNINGKKSKRVSSRLT